MRGVEGREFLNPLLRVPMQLAPKTFDNLAETQSHGLLLCGINDLEHLVCDVMLGADIDCFLQN